MTWPVCPYWWNICIPLSQPTLCLPYNDAITPFIKSRWEANLPHVGVSCKLQRWFGKKPHQWEHLVCFGPSRQSWEKAATPGPRPHSANPGRASAEDSLLSSSLSPPTLMSLALFCFPTFYICLLTVHRGTGTPKGPPFYRIKRCHAQTLVLKSHYRTNYTCWYDGGMPVVCHYSQSLPKSLVGADLFQRQSTKCKDLNASSAGTDFFKINFYFILEYSWFTMLC